MPVFDGEYPAARNLVQPRHRQAPSFSHERRTHGEATRNDEEPPKRVNSSASEGASRPPVWVRGFDRALKFASAQEARAFALNGLGHSLWQIGVAAPSDVRADELAGSLAAMRAA